MMNVLALCLAFTSLFAAEILSPNPEKSLNQREDVIVKEGHRIIVVETYDEDGQHNTKVSISPELQQQQQQEQEATVSAAGGLVYGVKEKVKEAAREVERNGERRATPGELICKAFGKCKRKIASVTGKAKDKVSEKAHESAGQQKEMAGEAEEKVEGAYEKAKESAAEKVQAAEEAYARAKESAAQQARDVKESARRKTQDTAKLAKDMKKTMEKDVVGNLSKKVEHAREQVAEKAKEAKVKTGYAKERVGRSVSGAARYVASSEVMNSLMGVTNLLGFATAYGMCVWVTFVSSYVLAGSLPRQQFALVQSKMYPVYFKAMAFCIGLTLLAHLVGKGKLIFTSPDEIFQGYNLMVSIFMVLFNALYLEPLATQVMFERMKSEKEEGRGRESLATESEKAGERQPAIYTTGAGGTSTTREEAPAMSRESREREEAMSKIVRLSGRLKMLNTYSSLLNIMTLMALTWHLVYLGQGLHITC